VRPYQLGHKDARVHCAVLKVRATPPETIARAPAEAPSDAEMMSGRDSPATAPPEAEPKQGKPRGAADFRRSLRTQQRAYDPAGPPAMFRPSHQGLGVLTRARTRHGRTGQRSTLEHRGGMNIRQRAWTPPNRDARCSLERR
jgi:hypothetical protein